MSVMVVSGWCSCAAAEWSVVCSANVQGSINMPHGLLSASTAHAVSLRHLQPTIISARHIISPSVCGFKLQQIRHYSMDVSTSAAAEPAAALDPLVQYVVLRRDLWTQLKWPLGSVTAQACHACTAAQWIYRDDPHVQQYMQDLDNMRKVVLEVKSEEDLVALAGQLNAAGIHHKLWIEQPENVPTCLATKPTLKSIVGPNLKKLPLCKTVLGK